MSPKSNDIIVRAGLVGQGLVGPSHFKGYQTHPNAEVIAVCDLSQERAEAFATEHNIRVCEEITVANIWKIKYLSGLGQPGLR